jgi:hypothetical protein
MLERNFVAKAKKSGMEFLLSYNSESVLCSITWEDTAWTYKAVIGIFKHIPVSIEDLEHRNKNEDHPFYYKETTQLDLSFEGFYKFYPVKQGKKIQAENAWQKMNDTDKAMAITYIPLLMRIKREDGTALPYASTYLNQKYWK